MTVGLWGCSDLDVLTATFDDELVEAQARTVALKVVDDADCPTLLRVEHGRVEDVANVLAVREGGYPINPESGILEDLPRGRPLVFDLSVLDRESRQIARACQGVTMPSSGNTEVTMTMRALPKCAQAPVALDVAIVLEASLAMRNADVALGSALVSRVAGFLDEDISAGGDRWLLVTHGPTVDPEVTVALTDDRDAVATAVSQTVDTFGGESRLYDAARLATVALRARAVCGRRSVVLAIAAGTDTGPLGGQQLAVAGLDGDRNTTDDDLFGVGIGVSADAKRALDQILIDTLGESQAALTSPSLDAALTRARERFRSLVAAER